MCADLAKEVAQFLPRNLNGPLGVAVSGGGDSMALLSLLAALRDRCGFDLRAVTVDHRLREEAGQEARMVSAYCATLGVAHTTLEWTDWDGSGNTQDAARRARYDLMAGWAKSEGVDTIALGHTMDDQAETVLMRLARGSGVDGLSAMTSAREDNGVTWLRPLLSVSRQALRDYLTRLDVKWIDDPSNDDPAYDRIKARRALAALAPLGIEAATLAQVAQNMQSARQALEQKTLDAARRIVAERHGALCLDWPALKAQPADITRRLVLGALQWVAGAAYPPRAGALGATLVRLETEPAATLDGCLLTRKRNNLWVSRELNAIEGHTVAPEAVWDRHWKITGPATPSGAFIGPLGEKGLISCNNWRDLGVPRMALCATPALWQGENLVAAPLVNSSGPWQAVRQTERASLFDAVFAH